MLGQRVAHPDSTNFWAGMASPDSKRVKREQSTDSSLSRTPSESDGVVEYPKLPTLPDAEIPDSEAESDGETFAPTQKTELESALAPVNTDKEAIAAYEASRAAGEISAAFLEDRINQRKWVKGKSSIYVDAFNLALETVLEDESHLFDEAEMAVFENWRGLDYEAQYL